MKSKVLFSGKAENYTKGRPTYSNALIEYIFTEIGVSDKSVVADIGSGTGIFSKQLLEKGCSVLGVEPNDDMRKSAIQELGNYANVQFIDGNAENTGLEAKSVDFITVAQAFHWFDAEKFKIESKRILKSKGIAMLIWNSRDTDCDFSKEHQIIFAKYCPNFKGFSQGIQKDDESIKHYFCNGYNYESFDNTLYYNKEQFISRSLSASYSIKDVDNGYKEYLTELNALFDRYSKEGILSVPNKSVVYWGEI